MLKAKTDVIPENGGHAATTPVPSVTRKTYDAATTSSANPTCGVRLVDLQEQISTAPEKTKKLLEEQGRELHRELLYVDRERPLEPTEQLPMHRQSHSLPPKKLELLGLKVTGNTPVQGQRRNRKLLHRQERVLTLLSQTRLQLRQRKLLKALQRLFLRAHRPSLAQSLFVKTE